MIGFLFVAAVVLVVALLAFRMIPAYIEWYTIQKALEAHVAEVHASRTLTAIRRGDAIASCPPTTRIAVTAKDVEISKQGNVVTASVSWQKNASAGEQREPPAGIRRVAPRGRHRAGIGWRLCRTRTRLHVSPAGPAAPGAHAPQRTAHRTTSGWNSSATRCSTASIGVALFERFPRCPKAISRGVRAALVNQDTLGACRAHARARERNRAGRRRTEERRRRSPVDSRRCARGGVRRRVPGWRLRRGARGRS